MTESRVNKARERDFYLRSLADLEQEYRAAEIKREDFEELRAQYVARAAQSIKSLDEANIGKTPKKQQRLRSISWIVGVVVVSAIAGIMLANFSGSRGSTDQVSGDIRASTRQRLFEAREAMANQEIDLAIEIYNGVLRDDPADVEALTYRGWLANLSGDPIAARDFVEQAIVVDSSFADARVFASSLLLAADEPLAAYDQLLALDRIDSGPYIEQLVESQQLDQNVFNAAGAAAVTLSEPILAGAAFDPQDVPVRHVVLAAEHLAANDRLDEGLALYQAMLVVSRDDPEVLVPFAWFLARASSGLEEGLRTAQSYLDSVIEAEPNHAEALVYRAFVHAELEEYALAQADLHAYDDLGVVRRDLDRLLAQSGLRELLDAQDA